MGQAPNDSAQKTKKPAWYYLTWWKTDAAEIERQVANYDTLSLGHSARGVSMILCLFSALLTAVLGRWLMQLSAPVIITELVVWSGLGFAMFRGQKWAFAAGMVLWTFEKASIVVTGVGASRVPITQVIWWCMYMTAFMLGFRVEKAREAKTGSGTSTGATGATRQPVATPLSAKPIRLR
jgi:hypothetical protein